MDRGGLDETTLSTLSLLESRLLRLEHLLYGQTATPSPPQDGSAALKLANLERRFGALTSHIRVYGELAKIHKSDPDFFHPPPSSEPPSQLSTDAILSIVLSSAPSYNSTYSALNAIKDSPIPEPSESTALIALGDRMKAIQATQIAQAAEMAELRTRSESVLRTWYEDYVIERSRFMADVGSRVEKVERSILRAEHEQEARQQV